MRISGVSVLVIGGCLMNSFEDLVDSLDDLVDSFVDLSWNVASLIR